MVRAHIVAEQHGEIRLLRIGQIDDLSNALFRHPGITGVNIGDYGDRELDILRPVRDLRRVFDERQR
jgi:hypothetical protein